MPDSEVVNGIFRLLPGFVAAWIFYGLTPHPKKSAFERVVQALIFTLFAETLANVTGSVLIFLGKRIVSVGLWTEEVAQGWRLIWAIATGLLASVAANTNWFTCITTKEVGKTKQLWSGLPSWLSRRTTYPSEWYSAFHRSSGWVILHLTGGRRIRGWAEEYPDQPTSGHFSLMEAAWLLDDNFAVELTVTERILIPASEVELVELPKSNYCEVMSNDQELLESNVRRMVAYNEAIEAKSNEGDSNELETRAKSTARDKQEWATATTR